MFPALVFPARFYYVVNRRLEDRVRELCALAVVARRDDERNIILAELRSALHEHTIDSRERPSWTLWNTNMVFKRDARLKLIQQAWPDALFGGMILVSVVGLVYMFTWR
jgi:hypothetical protein